MSLPDPLERVFDSAATVRHVGSESCATTAHRAGLRSNAAVRFPVTGVLFRRDDDDVHGGAHVLDADFQTVVADLRFQRHPVRVEGVALLRADVGTIPRD